MFTNMRRLAKMFAKLAHAGQVRKYTGEAYIVHPLNVVQILKRHGIEDDITLTSAWLHDTIEDTGTTYDEILSIFGREVADNVLALSDLEEGKNRADRKRKSRERLALANERVQNIKVADLIDNTSSIVEHDPEFAKVYLHEKRLLLDVLTKAKPSLLEEARRQISD